jgi:hypothetical protein
MLFNREEVRDGRQTLWGRGAPSAAVAGVSANIQRSSFTDYPPVRRSQAQRLTPERGSECRGMRRGLVRRGVRTLASS